MMIALLLHLSFAQSADIPLDAGTWVRKSLSALPVASATCVPATIGEMRVEWKEEHPQKGKRKPKAPSEEDLRDRAQNRDRICREVQERIEGGGTRWTSLPALRRFDDNPLPQDLEIRSRKALEHGIPGLEKELPEFGAPLRDWLAMSSVERAKSLQSDYQKNSMVAEKAHEEDIVASQTSKVIDAAWVMALRVEGLRLVRRKGTWIVAGRRTLGLWHFDARTLRFQRRALWDEAFDIEVVDPSRAAAAALGAGSFDGRLLQLEDFRFTAQMESSDRGWRPSAQLQTGSEDDLRVNRRFVYKERALESDGSTREKTVGFGYLESRQGSDSTWTLRHIGGRDPYDGLVAEEVPGNIWAVLGVEYRPWTIGGAASTPTSLAVGKVGPAWGIQGGWRGNAPGDLPDQALYLDLAVDYAPLTGTMERPETFGGPLERDLDGAWTLGASAGWLVRWPIRRLFLVGGAGVGARYMAVSLKSAAGGGAVPAFFDADRISTVQYHLDLVGGAQWSFSVGFGMGFEAGWEILRSDPAWMGRSKLGDFEVGAPGLEPGRVRFALQWVGG